MNTALIIFSAVSFLGYGTFCFFSKHTELEFARYRLKSHRFLVGTLQWAAGIGLIAGLFEPLTGRAAAAGLALMMLTAIGVRIRIKDTFVQTTPALFFLALNAYLYLAAF